MTLIHKYACENDLTKVQIELAKGIDINVRARGGETPLHAAASAGHVEMVQLLLEKGADIYIQEERGGKTPLFEAVIGIILQLNDRENYYKIFKLLLQREAELHRQCPGKYTQWLKDIRDRHHDAPVARLSRLKEAQQKLQEIMAQIEKEANSIERSAPVEIKLETASQHRLFKPDGLRQRKKTLADINETETEIKTMNRSNESRQERKNIIAVLSNFFSPGAAWLKTGQQQETIPLLLEQAKKLSSNAHKP